MKNTCQLSRWARIVWLIVATVYLCGGHIDAQTFSPRVEIQSNAIAASGPLTPMWLTANQWGIYRQGASAYANVKDTLVKHDHFLLNAGVGGVLNFPANESFIHEGYLSGRFYFVDFSAGLQAYSPTSYNDGLSSGMFLASSNARPIPRVSVGIYLYTDLPFAKQWVQVKGGISQGYLDENDDKHRGHQQVFLHEKFAYFRISHWQLKPYAGLIHSALYGGKGIKTDFWATFFAKGSAKLGGGEETNAAGAHMGLFDFGLDYRVNGWNAKFYFQKPFADGSGMHINWAFNRDHLVGLLLEKPSGKLVQAISFEAIKTTYQSGPGFPDPYDATLVNPDDPSQTGVYFFPGSMDDPAAFMAKYYPEVESTGWDKDDIVHWLQDKVNHGHHFAGRDDYMNNGMYYKGWTYYGRSTGTPLFHTADQVRKYAPDWDFRDEGTYFVNNRIIAYHFGMAGELFGIGYKLRATYTNNLGSYSREFFGRSSWERTDNYFYKGGLTQTYLGLDLSRSVTRNGNVGAFVSFALDTGQLYRSWGTKAGLTVRLAR